ncbi:hypothetical protein F443_18555, partial [Phytophthora nicotianae P1569]
LVRSPLAKWLGTQRRILANFGRRIRFPAVPGRVQTPCATRHHSPQGMRMSSLRRVSLPMTSTAPRAAKSLQKPTLRLIGLWPAPLWGRRATTTGMYGQAQLKQAGACASTSRNVKPSDVLQESVPLATRHPRLLLLLLTALLMIASRLLQPLVKARARLLTCRRPTLAVGSAWHLAT